MISDFLIVGGGIIGTTFARALAAKYPQSIIHLIEKEKQLGVHTSTRNSSVLHAGFCYSSDSFKAKFCKEGNKELTNYCVERKLPLLKTGKIVAPLSENDNKRIHNLFNQGIKNGIEMELLNSDQAKKVEPHLKIANKNFSYLWSPTTKVGDNKKVMEALVDDLKQLKNVKIFTQSKYEEIHQRKDESLVLKIKDLSDSNKKKSIYFETKKLINCAGLYADTVARGFSLCSSYTTLPFKGLYILDGNYPDSQKKLKTLVYPMPPPEGNFFLGVHLTLTCDGKLKFGPTATPTLSKENYHGFENISLREFGDILKNYCQNVFSKQFWFYLRHLQKELPKHYLPRVFHDAGKLVDIYENSNKNFLGYPKPTNISFTTPGIRAQLLNIKSRELVNDFIVEQEKSSLHLLNVVSPGWTCAFPLTKYVVEKYL